MLKKKRLFYHDNESLIELDNFIKSNLIGLKHFRYFKNRTYSVLKNHVYTSLYYEKNQLVGYGHLDLEGDKIFVGIMVSDNQVRKKIGTEILIVLIKNSSKSLYCTVDILNKPSFNLVTKNGFKILETKDTYYIMIYEN